MKKDFVHENFERFLKENADDLRMRPAVNVWNRIESRLNRRRRWVYFTSGFFLLTASLFGYVIIDQAKHPSDPFAGIHTIQKKTAASKTLSERNSGIAVATVTQPNTAVPYAASGSIAKTPARAELFQNPIALSNTASELATTTNEPLAFTPAPLDEWQPATAATQAPKVHQPNTQQQALTIESVVNSYQPKLHRNKPEFQLFFTPTISYRRLTENKSYLRSVPQNLATYNLAALYDVNSMVTHKPDMGLEFGFGYKFPVTSRLKLRTGLQFNITRYSIRAFNYVPERTTIALNNGRRGIDSFATMSSYRNYNNFNGTGTDWLQNFYFQVSAPVGVEVALTPAAKKTRFGVATSIQPTYVLGDRAYLISSDYKNYSQVPWLIRRWNVNTSLETFVSYSTGKLRWQVGPQIRYQLLSSFIEQYPVKENLFDFGMKVGVSLDKK